MSACGTDGKTSPERENVDCQRCKKLMPPEGSTPIFPKVALGSVPPFEVPDVYGPALDELLRRGLVHSSDELKAALGVLIATAKDHRNAQAARSGGEIQRLGVDAFYISNATSEEYNELVLAIMPLIKALGRTLDD